MFWNNKHPKDSVFSVILWVYVISRLFGFWPFSIVFDEKRKTSNARVTITDWIWFFVAIVLYASFIYFNDLDKYKDLPHSFIEICASQLTLIGGNMIAILSIIMDMLNRGRICRVIEMFNEFDAEVRIINEKIIVISAKACQT